MSLLNALPANETIVPELAKAFKEYFSTEADGIYSAPGRVNIIGEHVDYQGGLCLPMAITHRCYVAVKKTATNKLRMRSLQQEQAVEIELDKLRPGALSGWSTYVAGVLWALEEYFQTPAQGLDILVDGYVPLGAGLSSSAALECAVAEAIEDQYRLQTTAKQRIKAAIKAENEFAGANTGGLDQSAAILSKAGSALLLDCLDFSTKEVPWDLASQNLALLICDTKASHNLVDGEYATRRSQAEAAAKAVFVDVLRELKPSEISKLAQIEDETVRARARHIVNEIQRVKDFQTLLNSATVRKNLLQLGALLTASHVSLRDEYEVSVDELDVAVDAALKAGAYGARMTGGGFGGSIIALVEADSIENVAQAIFDAFATKGYAPPEFFLATPSAGARREA